MTQNPVLRFIAEYVHVWGIVTFCLYGLILTYLWKNVSGSADKAAHDMYVKGKTIREAERDGRKSFMAEVEKRPGVQLCVLFFTVFLLLFLMSLYLRWPVW